MATVIRLQRAGAKKKPYYKLVVADRRSPRDGKFIERVGSYNPSLPSTDENRFTVKSDRVEQWLKTGAIPSEKAAVLLNKAGVGKTATTAKNVLERRDQSIGARKNARDLAAQKKLADEAAAAAEVKAAEDAKAAEAKAAEDAKAAEAASAEAPAA